MAVNRLKRLPSLVMGAAALAAMGMALNEIGGFEVIGEDGRNWFWIWIILGGILGWLGRERLAGIFGLGTLLLLLLIQWTPWPATLARQFIRNDPLPKEPVDGIVVLSASVTDEARISQVAVDRLLEGLHLYRSGVSHRLIVSRIERVGPGKPIRPDWDQRGLIGLAGGQPEVHTLWPVGTTRTEALRMAELAAKEGWHTIVVVTSPTHTRRACAVFEAVGLKVICRASPDRQVAWSRLDSPADRTRAVAQWAYETVGWWSYRWRGWIVTPTPSAGTSVEGRP